MSSQDALPLSDASTRHKSGILAPPSDISLDSSHGLDSGSKKRKRDGNTMEDLLKDSFVVKPYPPIASSRSRCLQPLLLLPRSQLPLSCLDIASPADALPKSRLFETHVKILELEERMGSQPMVLIARLDDGRTLHAVEREGRGLYVICQLGSWVDIQQLRAAAVVSNEDPVKAISTGLINTARDNFTIPFITTEASKYNKKKRLAIEAIQSMVKRPSTGTATESQPVPEPGPRQQIQNKVQNTNDSILDDAAVQPTATETLDLRTQYFESLYLSKASLAYFAKGPLSRARAAFHLDYDSTLDINEHITFLESLVMSNNLIDKKYRQGVPGCIASIDLHDYSADDATSRTKKRKSKKMRPGKTGLYPSEDALIRKWWTNHDEEAESGIPGASKEETIKSRISHLRARETQLQIVVILEIMALRPLVSGVACNEGLPTALLTATAANSTDKSTKSKKPDQLTTLVDFHIDRLCIWQSIEIEAMKPPVNDSQNPEKSGLFTGVMKYTDNILRDFCVDVIGPFFSARLPDRCDIINRKLGGPVAISPPKPQPSKSSGSSGSSSRPGAATKRPVPVKPRRSLQRVLSDDREQRSMSRGSTRAPSLMRSITAPVDLALKREGSEAPSLSGIPFAEPKQLQANRGGILNSKRFSRREIDMSSLAPKMKSKAEKEAIIAAELKDAILALKKPNRDIAGKFLVEMAEKRSALARSSRKSKKPVRNPLFQGVQISATPKANRQKNMVSQPQLLSLGIPADDVSVNTQSSRPIIPQTVTRQFQGELQLTNPLYESVQASPTLRKVSTTNPGSILNGGTMDYHGCPPSPLDYRGHTQYFDAIPESVVKNRTRSMPIGVLETPIKKRPEPNLEHSHPASSANDKENEGAISRMNDEMKPEIALNSDSIYKSLGWDVCDDIDEFA